VVVLAAAAVILLLTVFRPVPANEPDLAPLLAALDSSISGGSLSTAADQLSSLRTLPREEPDRLRLLKRAWEVSSGSGDYTTLANLSARMLGLDSGPRVTAIAAYADLRAGRVSDALRIVSGGSPAAEATAALRGEGLLRSGARWQGSDELSRTVLALEGSSDPSAFVQSALRSDDSRLALDGALLAMENGSPGLAVAIASSELGEARFDEAAGTMFYDAGVFDQALTRLERRYRDAPATPGLGFLLADVAAASGNASASEAFTLRALPGAPGLSWTPYANLARWSVLRGDAAGALLRLDDGLAFFPQSRELRLMKARVLIRAGDSTGAEAVLQGLVADRPSDVESALLLLSVQGPALSPEAGRGRLWKIFGQAPQDPLVFDSLCTVLAAARDWEGIKIAVKQHALAGGQPDAHALTLMGLAAAMTGDSEGAISAFRQADQAQRDGISRTDLALAMIQKGATRAARSELDAAEDEVRQASTSGATASLLSRIETIRAASFMLEGNAAGAASAIARARSLDPANLKAALMAQKLAAANQ